MDELLALADAVRHAGDAALRMWPGSGAALKSWNKAPGQIVCDADLAVDAALKATLGGIDPGAGWLSEESADNPSRLASERVWIVDPIDGTRDFVRGRPGWCVSVAMVVAGAPLFAVLYAPVSNRLWMARAGYGATCNGMPIHTSQRTALVGARVPANELARDDRLFDRVAQPNSIALRIACVAENDADFVATQRWGAEWDIAAAALIATEAGAIVTDARGKKLRFNQPVPRSLGIVASAPAIHASVVAHFSPRAAKAEMQG